MSMTASLNGRAGADGQLRTAGSGKEWCRLSLAVEVGLNRESGQAEVEWIQIVAFDDAARIMARAFKGQSIRASGRMEKYRWTGRDGAERIGWKLLANAVEIARSAPPAGGRPKAQGRGGTAQRGGYGPSHRVQEPGDPGPDPNDELVF